MSGLAPADWERPTLLEPPEAERPPWTVLQLAAHFDVFMGLTLGLAAEPVSAQPVVDRASFYSSVSDRHTVSPVIYQYIVDHAHGHGPATICDQVNKTFAQALEAIRTTPPDTIGPGFFGPMRLDEFVATRLVETRVHGLDLTDALGPPLGAASTRSPQRRESSPAGAAYECSGWPEGQAVALDSLGLAHWRSDQLHPAATYLTRSLAVARRTGWRAGEICVLGNLGAVSAELGMLQQAADHFTAALGLKPEWAMGAGLLDGLGEVSYNRGRLDQALDHLTEALARFREIGHRAGQSDALRNLAGVHTDAGRYDQALELASGALEFARQIGSRLLEAGALKALGDTEQRLGRHRAALERYEQARQLALEARTRGQEVDAMVGLATANRHLGRLDLAIEPAVQARQLAGEAGYRILEGHAGSALAEIQLACGRPDRAVCPGRSPCQRSASPICTLRVGAGRLPRPPRAWPGGTDDPLLPSGDSQTMIGRP